MNRSRTGINRPAVSAQWAMLEYPHARDAERSALLDLADLKPGTKIVDLQAAGGYLADGIDQRLEGDVEVVCIEPEPALNRRINPRFRVVPDPVESWQSVPSSAFDAVLGLAGLHHSEDQQATVDEAFRALRPSGTFAVCEVIDESAVALWLNEFVHLTRKPWSSGGSSTALRSVRARQ